jgi:hypothetical protein
MKTISISEIKHYFDSSTIQVLHEPISVTDQQKEVAVILSPEDFYQLVAAAKKSVDDIKPKTLVDFLGAGRAHSRFSTNEDIDALVLGNRELWDV